MHLSKMKIAVMVRQLDLGHILWCGRVVRVERAHRVRVMRDVQKMPDVGNGVIGFDHVRFHVRDLVAAPALTLGRVYRVVTRQIDLRPL
jgi:hypothetical protein